MQPRGRVANGGTPVGIVEAVRARCRRVVRRQGQPRRDGMDPHRAGAGVGRAAVIVQVCHSAFEERPRSCQHRTDRGLVLGSGQHHERRFVAELGVGRPQEPRRDGRRVDRLERSDYPVQAIEPETNCVLSRLELLGSPALHLARISGTTHEQKFLTKAAEPTGRT